MISPVHKWTEEKIGYNTPIDQETLASYQISKLHESLNQAKRGAYYSKILDSFTANSFVNLDDLSKLPFTCADYIQADPGKFLCVPQSQVARIITLNTSGTKGSPKRIFFTDNDLERCVDFFLHGMLSLTGEGETVGIFLGQELPGGTVELLNKALGRIGAKYFNYNLFNRCDDRVDFKILLKASCLVGFPVNILQLAKSHPELCPEKVLLCSDYAPESVVKSLCSIWGCEVYNHYGSTESGLGGGVECWSHNGYHLRDIDLIFEIVDPYSGHPLPAGSVGEVVFTTLSREAMPLIRYRTGDLAMMIDSPCECGSKLRRLSKIEGRISNFISFNGRHDISIHRLDEIMFSMPNVYDYQAVITGADNMEIIVSADGNVSETVISSLINDSIKPGFNFSIKISESPMIFTGEKRTIKSINLNNS